jgi:hypothetical protein
MKWLKALSEKRVCNAPCVIFSALKTLKADEIIVRKSSIKAKKLPNGISISTICPSHIYGSVGFYIG